MPSTEWSGRMSREQRPDRGRGNEVRDINAMARDTTYCRKESSATVQDDSGMTLRKIACGRSTVQSQTARSYCKRGTVKLARFAVAGVGCPRPRGW